MTSFTLLTGLKQVVAAAWINFSRRVGAKVCGAENGGAYPGGPVLWASAGRAM